MAACGGARKHVGRSWPRARHDSPSAHGIDRRRGSLGPQQLRQSVEAMSGHRPLVDRCRERIEAVDEVAVAALEPIEERQRLFGVARRDRRRELIGR